jgi:peptidoglycan/LPS O-acetylase OafA/YrhL
VERLGLNMKQDNNFGMARLLAAMLVVYGHSFDLLRAPSGIVWLDAEISSFAVRIFFVISGYLICASWNKDPSLHRFFIKRALRIFPALIMVVLLCVFVLGPVLTTVSLGAYFGDRDLYDYLWNVALEPHFVLPGVFASNPFPNAVNGSLWTLPAEFLMYLLIPIYATRDHRICRVFLFPAAFLGVLALGFYFTWLRPQAMQPVLYCTSLAQVARWAPYFLGGAAISIWRLERHLRLDVALLMILALTCVGPGFYEMRSVAIMLLTPYLVLAFCLPKSTPLPFWSADISYGVYLYAFPVQQTVIQLSHGKIGPVAVCAVSLPIVFALGYLSWNLVERPMLTMKPWKERRIVGVATEMA